MVRIGWLRQEGKNTYPEIRANLPNHIKISRSQVRYTFQHVYLPLLAFIDQRQQKEKLDKVVL